MISKANAQAVMNTGILNETVKGYLIQACRNVQITDREQIKDLLCGLSWAFDDMTADDAERVYNEFRKG